MKNILKSLVILENAIRERDQAVIKGIALKEDAAIMGNRHEHKWEFYYEKMKNIYCPVGVKCPTCSKTLSLDEIEDLLNGGELEDA